ncbi:MAG: type VI secretion system-associated FHA domain protein TagH [Geminicoccaceae bacterium]
MQLTLHLEQGTFAGETRSVTADRFVIGRGADSDWTLADPEQRLSRQHCIIERRGDGFSVKDVSRNGVYVNGASSPLGQGRERRLADGDQLSIGPYVIRIALQTDEAAPAPVRDDNQWFDPTHIPRAEPKEGAGRIFDKTWLGTQDMERADHRRSSLPSKPDKRFQVGPEHRPVKLDTLEGDKTPGDDGVPLFDQADSDRPPADETFDPPAEDARNEALPDDPFAAFNDEPADETASTEAPPPSAPPPVETAPAPAPAAGGGEAQPGDRALIDAFLKGAGLAPDALDVDDAEAFMQEAGARLSELVNGLVQLLRARTTVKSTARIERTMLGADHNNPLKFADSLDEALIAVLVRGRSGFMEPETAIQSGFRDLQEHEIALLDAMQVAVRSLLQNFDPENFEMRMEAENALAALVSGGRQAKCWKLFKARYEDIASQAEREFLGAVGRDFARAYENNLRRR